MAASHDSWSWGTWGDGTNSFALDDEEDEETEGVYHSKDCLLIMIDANSTMFEALGDEIPFRNALKTVGRVFKDKIIANENDLIGVAFYNTGQKKNPNEFEHIHIYYDMDNPDVFRITDVESAIGNGGQDEGEWFSGGDSFPLGHGQASFDQVLWTVSALFGGANIPKNANKRVFLITNDDNPNSDDAGAQGRAKQRAKDLMNLNIDIELFAFNKNGYAFNPSLFFKDVLAEDEDGVAPEFNAITKFEEMESIIKRKEFKRRVYGHVPLTICENPRIEIGVNVYNLVIAAKKGNHVWLEAKTNKRVKTTTKQLCEDTCEFLLPNQIKRYLPYGDAMVFFEPDEIKKMKSFGDPGFKLMGFKPKKSLEPYMNLKHSQFIMPNEKVVQGSTVLFIALHRKMLDLGKIAICRLVMRKNAAARFVALLPQEEEEAEDGFSADVPLGMHIIPLPYTDDLRNLNVEGEDATVEQIRECKKLVKALEIDFDSDYFPNPVLQNHYNTIQAVALGQDVVDDVVDQTLPDLEGMTGVAHIVRDFKDTVYPPGYEPLERALPKKRKASDGGGPPKKKVCLDIDVDSIDWFDLASRGLLGKQTVPYLREYLRRQGVPVTSKDKKADLVEKAKEHLGF